MTSQSVRHNIFQFRATNDELDTLHTRAKSMSMSLSEYVRWRSLQPIGRLKSPQARKALDQSTFGLYINLTKELNRQGINLNQIAKSLNSAEIDGRSMKEASAQLVEIRKSIQVITTSIQHLGADP